MTRNLSIAIATGVVVCLDQISKAWALVALEDRIIDLVWTLRLRLVYNTGFAFSAGSGLGPVLALVALVIVGVLWSSRRRVQGVWGAIGLGGIIGGALGNLADRVFRGLLGGVARWWTSSISSGGRSSTWLMPPSPSGSSWCCSICTAANDAGPELPGRRLGD